MSRDIGFFRHCDIAFCTAVEILIQDIKAQVLKYVISRLSYEGQSDMSFIALGTIS